jgi:hypothetical protein
MQADLDPVLTGSKGEALRAGGLVVGFASLTVGAFGVRGHPAVLELAG